MSANETALYPLRFEPIYQYRPWGGRRLGNLLSVPLPAEGPIGEVWLLSDRDDHPSVIAEGPLRGKTIRQLWEHSALQLMGESLGKYRRFPLLLKFLDVTKRLSIQVHPSDAQTELTALGETGKTEAWVVLERGPRAHVYAGFKVATTTELLRRAIADGDLVDRLASFTPELGDGILIEARTVHSLSDVVVFEVQENSDTTFRLYDWDQIDSRTGNRRALQVEQSLACIDLKQLGVDPVIPRVVATRPVLREELFHANHFNVVRISGRVPFAVGAERSPHVLVCLEGVGQLENADRSYNADGGNVLLLPAEIGSCSFQPFGAVTLLEISLPDIS